MTEVSTPAFGSRFELLYQLSQTFNSSLDLDEVLNRVMDEVIEAIGAERGFVALKDEEGSLEFRSARGIEHTSIEDPESQISKKRRPYSHTMPKATTVSAIAPACSICSYARFFAPL